MVHTKTSHHDRMEVFLEKYREPLPKPLEELERKALSEDVPIIRSGTRDMLRFLLRESIWRIFPANSCLPDGMRRKEPAVNNNLQHYMKRGTAHE